MLQPSWVGRRVSVRRALGRASDGRPLFGDVVGDLVELGPERAVILGRHGRDELDVGTIAIAKLVPPSTADELALEAVAARGWQAEHTEQLGGWLLRAAGGYTGRANSVLPLGAPGMPLDEALDTARSWYTERGLPLRIQLPTEARRLLDAELAERGWTAEAPDVHVLAARLDAVESDGTVTVDVAIDERPDEAWLARSRDGAGAGPHARGVLQRHDHAVFAAVREDGRAIAIGRGALDDGWLGVTAVEVDPARRRQGLAVAVMRALWDWGRQQGADRTYLQVSADNTAALALYRRLGYWEHHDYRYRDDPAVSG